MEASLKKAIFNDLYLQIDGYGLAEFDKKEFGLWGVEEYTYGEIDFEDFLQIILRAPLKPEHKIFYDLGSGIGKPVIAAAMSGQFNEAWGIEILPRLYQASQQVQERLAEEFVELDCKIEFIQGNFFEIDFSAADVIFIQCTCMGDKTIKQLGSKLTNLKKGSVVITCTKMLDQNIFFINDYKKCKMGWGEATVYFHVKK